MLFKIVKVDGPDSNLTPAATPLLLTIDEFIMSEFPSFNLMAEPDPDAVLSLNRQLIMDISSLAKIAPPCIPELL